ncbi:Tat pathway signal sequence [Acidipropionibacterium timonense]|uniref:Tat pathway signal sequence n=1 Tax=Acidipropionibacterium timonense TaxID=2161818 RepID=UPI0010319813|nr:Tat pathway signal sequence [Acidipropionibacterium timonense]
MKFTSPDAMTRRAVLAGLALGGITLGAGLTGCSGSQKGDGDVDSSWVTAEVGHVSVRHPAEWVEKESSSKIFTKMFTNGTSSMLIAGDFSSNTDPVLAYGKLDAQSVGVLEGYHSKGHEEITVKGAAKAVKCPFQYTQDGKTAYGWWLIASGAAPIGGTSVVSINLPTDDSDTVDKIVSTMELSR